MANNKAAPKCWTTALLARLLATPASLIYSQFHWLHCTSPLPSIHNHLCIITSIAGLTDPPALVNSPLLLFTSSLSCHYPTGLYTSTGEGIHVYTSANTTCFPAWGLYYLIAHRKRCELYKWLYHFKPTSDASGASQVAFHLGVKPI